MAHPLRKFLKVQRGAETVWGTPPVGGATAILAGLNDIRYRPDYKVEQPDYLNGSLARAQDTADVLGKAGALTLGGYMSFEDLPYLLVAGYKNATPSADAGTPTPAQTWTVAPTLSSEDTPKSSTLEAGGNTESWQFPGCVLAGFEFTAQMKGYTMFTSTWLAKDMTSAAFTSALTKRTVERVLAQQWVVTADDTDAGLGTTNITSCLTEIRFQSGPLYGFSNCINGLLTPTDVSQMINQQPTIVLTFKLSAETAAFFNTYLTGGVKFLRLKNTSNLIAIHGTPNVFKSVQIDVAANILAYPEVGQAVTENHLTIPLTFQGVESTTWGKMIEWKVVNQIATLP